MRVGTVIGTLAALGTATLIVLAQRQDPASLEAANTTPVYTTTTTTTTTTTLPPTTSSTTTTTTLKPTTTTTTEGPFVAADYTVQVLNAGAKKGQAKKRSEDLGSLGYQMLEPADAVDKVDGAVVMYATGQLRTGQVIAFLLQVPAGNVIEQTDDANWLTYGEGKADVIVLLGK